jgi:hypothetical protein
VPGALALGGVVLLASTGWRRGNLPSVGPTTSRYVYMTVAFLLPLVAMAAQGLFRGSTARRVALGVVTVLLVVAQVRVLDREARVQEIGKRQDRGATSPPRLAREGHRSSSPRRSASSSPDDGREDRGVRPGGQARVARPGDTAPTASPSSPASTS